MPKQKKSLLIDLFIGIGVIMVGVGLWFNVGLGTAVVAVGALLILFGAMGALR